MNDQRLIDDQKKKAFLDSLGITDVISFDFKDASGEWDHYTSQLVTDRSDVWIELTDINTDEKTSISYLENAANYRGFKNSTV